ncbi:MAG: hypothetical protein F9K18_12300 [Thermoanaerobaculia bacterium]|nr:MAG: hypothetical protein F9K18_12300 [Thermoanaerobaculia bacterium]
MPCQRAVLGTAVLAFVLVAAPGEAQPTFYHRGTAVIDGVQAVGEWTGAEAADLMVTLPVSFGGASVPVTLFYMNDDANLYVAARLEYDQPVWNPDFLVLLNLAWPAELDFCDAATVIDEHDLFSQDGNPFHFDMFAEHLTGCDVQLQTPDESAGGTSEGSGMWASGGGATFFEIAQPLDTADDAHDLSVAVGDRIRTKATVAGCDGTGDCGTPAELDLRIFLGDAGIFFFSDFETGDTSEWSVAVP